MELSNAQREAIRALYANGCSGTIGPGGWIVSSGAAGSTAGKSISGNAETWLRLITMGLAMGNGPHSIRLTYEGEQEAKRSLPSTRAPVIEITTGPDGVQRVRTGRA